MSLDGRQPLLIRALNGAGPVLKLLGLEFGELTPSALKASAVRATGLEDFGTPDFEEGLSVVTESLKADTDLSLLGRVGLRDYLELALSTRLSLQALRKQKPEIFDAPLNAPLIVLGLPRSGTTHLHRLLSLAPKGRALRYFEVRRPIAPEGDDDRVAWARSQYRTFRMLAPGLDAKHFSGPEEPEECVFLFDSTMVSVTFWIAAPVYGYLDWYQEQDQRPAYRQYREHLQIFQRETPEQRLILKAPIHTAYVEALLAAIPDAKLVQLHRDPVPVLTSVSSLFYTLHRAVTPRVDPRRMARANFEFLVRGIERNLAARRVLDPSRIIDVYYDDLVASPEAVVQRICDFHGLPFDDEFRRRVTQYAQQNPQHKHGAHRYSSSEFGLSDGEIRERFTDYMARFPGLRQARG